MTLLRKPHASYPTDLTKSSDVQSGKSMLLLSEKKRGKKRKRR